MINITDLTKYFGDFAAVDHINLEIQPGEIFGLLGPNGSGKSTTINMLLGILKPSGGAIRLFGKPFDGADPIVKKRIGVVFESHPLVWSWATGREYLQFFERLYEVDDGSRRIDTYLEMLGLKNFADTPFNQYSRGMLQRLNIIRALIPDPDILILDEPISGLDVIGIREVRDLILRTRRESRSILISSHILSEMERMCDRAGIIYEGRICAVAPMDELTRGNQILVEVEHADVEMVREIEKLAFVQQCTLKGNTFTVITDMDKDYRREFSEFFYGKGWLPLSLSSVRGSLEETLIKYTDISSSDGGGMLHD